MIAHIEKDLTETEKQLLENVLKWARSGPSFSAVHLSKGQTQNIKARLEVHGGIDILALTKNAK